MIWTMPPETAPQTCTWMAFPRAGKTLGTSTAEREAGYAAWAEVANTIARFQPVRMLVDPTEETRARRMLDGQIQTVTHQIADFWMRDSGPSFVTDGQGGLGAVDWIFNGWGGRSEDDTGIDNGIAGFVADLCGARRLPSLLINEGGGIQVDGAGTVLLTETVQLDPGRNPLADKARIEAEVHRLLGTSKAVWLKRGLTRDYDAFGTHGHVDIVAALPRPGTLLLHSQPNPEHPDHAVMAALRSELAEATDAAGTRFEIIDLPAPDALRDGDGFVDYSYVNHAVVNGAVIACGFDEPRADAQAREILSGVYPGRDVVTLDAREIFARGGGIHCITQQQPKV